MQLPVVGWVSIERISDYLQSYFEAKTNGRTSTHSAQQVLPFKPYPARTFSQYDHVQLTLPSGTFVESGFPLPFSPFLSSVVVMYDHMAFFQRDGWVNVRLNVNISTSPSVLQVVHVERAVFEEGGFDPQSQGTLLFTVVGALPPSDPGLFSRRRDGPEPTSSEKTLGNAMKKPPKSQKTTLKTLWKAVKTGRYNNTSSASQKEISTKEIPADLSTMRVASGLVRVKMGDLLFVRGATNIVLDDHPLFLDVEYVLA